MNCPRCNHDVEIQFQNDSFYHIMKCGWCGWWTWLSQLNKKKPVKDAGNINS